MVDESKIPERYRNAYMCQLEEMDFDRNFPEAFKEMKKNPKYCCGHCKRKAAQAKNLHKPVEIVRDEGETGTPAS